jgi:hypothetical protein
MTKFTVAAGILTISVGILLALPSLDASAAERWTLVSYNKKEPPKKGLNLVFPQKKDVGTRERTITPPMEIAGLPAIGPKSVRV